VASMVKMCRVTWVNELSPYFLLLPPPPRIYSDSWPAWRVWGRPVRSIMGAPKPESRGRHLSAESGRNDRGAKKTHPNRVVSVVKEVLANNLSYSDRRSTQRAPRTPTRASPTSREKKKGELTLFFPLLRDWCCV